MMGRFDPPLVRWPIPWRTGVRMIVACGSTQGLASVLDIADFLFVTFP